MIKKYSSVPFTKGNLIFPAKILIDTRKHSICFWKKNKHFIGYKKSTVLFKNIARITIHQNNEFLYFSSIHIETTGGHILVASGFSPKQTKEIQYLVENL